MADLHIDDIGSTIVLTITESGSAKDLTGATVTLWFTRPDKTTVNKSGSIQTPATAGKVEYVTESGFLSQTGRWEIQARVVQGARQFWSTFAAFYVYGAPA